MCGFVHSKERLYGQNLLSLLSTRISRLYGLQPSPVVLYMQNIDFRTRITSLCGSQTPPVVFACKTTNSGPEYQVSMGPRHDLWFSACTTACLASELPVSMGQNPHLRISIAKQRLLVQIYNYLWAPDLTCRFVHANIRD